MQMNIKKYIYFNIYIIFIFNQFSAEFFIDFLFILLKYFCYFVQKIKTKNKKVQTFALFT